MPRLKRRTLAVVINVTKITALIAAKKKKGDEDKNKDKSSKNNKDKSTTSEFKEKLLFFIVQKSFESFSFIIIAPTALSALSNKLDLANN